MNDDIPILGYRKDRVGARLSVMLDGIRLARKFGITARYQWLSGADGTYPQFGDPHMFFDSEFVLGNIDVVDERPDFEGRDNLTASSTTIASGRLGQRLARGDKFHLGDPLGPVTLMDESYAENRKIMGEIARSFPLSARMRSLLDEAVARIKSWSGRDSDRIAGIHLRRGDLMDSIPWSLSSWQSKFVPDEFFRLWAEGRDEPIVVFTDSPDAVAHMAAGDPQFVPVAELVDLNELTLGERDFLELLLMSRCRIIAAPHSSAFSQAAAIIGGGEVQSLPFALAPAARVRGYDDLVTRVLDGAESFFASGDFAQSAQYAGLHALHVGRAGVLARSLLARDDLCRAHPFLYRIATDCALAADDLELVAVAAQRGMADPRILPRDKRQCNLALQLIETQRSPKVQAAADVFLSSLFGGAAGPDRFRDRLAKQQLESATETTKYLMISVPLMQKLARVNELPHPPFWAYLSDWQELLKDDTKKMPLRVTVPLELQIRQVGEAGTLADQMFSAGDRPPLPESQDVINEIGLTASLLALHGRFARALKLLHWIEEIDSQNPLLHKRLADACFELGNPEAGTTHLTQAIELAPDNPLLHLSMARRMVNLGQGRQATQHLDLARELWPDSETVKRQRNTVRKALAALAPSADSPGKQSRKKHKKAK